MADYQDRPGVFYPKSPFACNNANYWQMTSCHLGGRTDTMCLSERGHLPRKHLLLQLMCIYCDFP